MKTKQLIQLLAECSTPIGPHDVRNRLAASVVGGLLMSTLLLVVLLGVRSDISSAITTATFWSKSFFGVFMLSGGVFIAAQLSKPGQAVKSAWYGVILPIAVITLALIVDVNNSPDGTAWRLLSDQLWRRCPLEIALLSTPTLVALLYAMKPLAPTKLAVAGGVAGLIAGSIAALTYSLRCPEVHVAFWGSRYLLGIAIPSAVGCVIGPRFLRW